MKKKVIEKIKKSESTISMLLGVVVVVVVSILLVKYFKGLSGKIKNQEENIDTEISDELGELSGEETIGKKLPGKYTVILGDSLWKISIKFYGEGYNWVDISRENELVNPNILIAGQELIIPNVSEKKEIGDVVKPKSLVSIEGNNYVIEKGDSLWNISVRAYLDGYKWVEIAKANNLSNPNLIHPGNQLIIPRL